MFAKTERAGRESCNVARDYHGDEIINGKLINFSGCRLSSSRLQGNPYFLSRPEEPRASYTKYYADRDEFIQFSTDKNDLDINRKNYLNLVTIA